MRFRKGRAILQAVIEEVKLSRTHQALGLCSFSGVRGGRVGSQALLSEPDRRSCPPWWAWVQHYLGRGIAMWLLFWGFEQTSQSPQGGFPLLYGLRHIANAHPK